MHRSCRIRSNTLILAKAALTPHTVTAGLAILTLRIVLTSLRPACSQVIDLGCLTFHQLMFISRSVMHSGRGAYSEGCQ